MNVLQTWMPEQWPPPKDIHFLISEPVTIHGKRDSAGVIELSILRWGMGGYPRLPG